MVAVLAAVRGQVETFTADGDGGGVIRAGVVPTTTQAVLGELQRDWAREKTLPGVTDISILHAGSFGTSLGWELHLLGSTD